MKQLNSYVRWLLMAMVATVTCLCASCTDDPVYNALRPPYELKNEFMFNEEIIPIQSIVWEKDQETDLYTFYITPRKGLQYVDDVLKVDDYVKLEVENPSGVINPETSVWAVNYKTIKASNKTRAVEQKPLNIRAFTVELNEAKGTLNMSVIFGVNASQECINLNFHGNEMNGLRKATLPTLLKQWQYKKDFTTIQSVMEQRYVDHNELYLAAEANVTDRPAEDAAFEYIKLSVDNSVEEEVIDLATADLAKVEVSYGEVSNQTAKSIEGTLKIAKSGAHNVNIELEALIDGKLLRAAWSGNYFANYEAANTLSLTPAADQEPINLNLTTVFRDTRVDTNMFYAGVNPDAKTLEELMDSYAFQFNIAELGGEVDLATASNYNLKVFDYKTYKTYDSAKMGLTGTLTTELDPQGENEHLVLIRLNAEFVNGPKVVMDWYAPVTPVDGVDITPVDPFVPYIKITSKKGEVIADMEITQLQIQEVNDDYGHVGGTHMTKGKRFYFINEKTYLPDLGSYDSAASTPCLMFNDEYLNQENIDLTQKNPIFEFEYRPFNSSGFASPSDWMGTTQKGTATVKQDGKNWYIKVEILDWAEKWGMMSGTENTITIEWKGPATAYQGK